MWKEHFVGSYCPGLDKMLNFPGTHIKFPTRKVEFTTILYAFLYYGNKISLPMVKIHRTEVPQFSTFSRHDDADAISIFNIILKVHDPIF